MHFHQWSRSMNRCSVLHTPYSTLNIILLSTLQPVVLIHPPEQHPPNPSTERLCPVLYEQKYSGMFSSPSPSVCLSSSPPKLAPPLPPPPRSASTLHSPPPVRRPPLLLPLRALLSEPEREVETKMVSESEGGRSGRPPAHPVPPLLVATPPFAGSGDDVLSIPLFRCWAGAGAGGGWSGRCSGGHDGDERGHG